MKNLALAFAVFLSCLMDSAKVQATSELNHDDETSNIGEIEGVQSQLNIAIIEPPNPDTLNRFKPFEADQKTDNSKLNVVTVPFSDLEPAATGYDKHKGHKEGHHKHEGQKGKKGFHADEGHKKKHYADHGKHHKSGHHDKGGKHYKGHDHHKKHHSDWHKGKKGKKGHHHHIKGHHDKGHKDKGFKNVYHKEEYGHNKKFYDDFDFKKHHKKYDDFNLHYKGHKGDTHKSGKFKGDKHHNKYSKKGDFHKGSKHDDHHGVKKKYGHKKHYDEHSEHAKKKGKDKKYGHKHGSKHGHHDHHGHYSEQYPLYDTPINSELPDLDKDDYNARGTHNHEKYQGQYSHVHPNANQDHHGNHEDDHDHDHRDFDTPFIHESRPSKTYSSSRNKEEPQTSSGAPAQQLETYLNPEKEQEYDYDETVPEQSYHEQPVMELKESEGPTIEYESDYDSSSEQKNLYITIKPAETNDSHREKFKTKSSPIRKYMNSKKLSLKPFDMMPPIVDAPFQQPLADRHKFSSSKVSSHQISTHNIPSSQLSPPPQYDLFKESVPVYIPKQLASMNSHRIETPHRDIYWNYQLKEYPKPYPKRQYS